MRLSSSVIVPTSWLWQYGLWSFQTGDTKLERFCLRINIPKGNYWILSFGLMMSLWVCWFLSKNISNFCIPRLKTPQPVLPTSWRWSMTLPFYPLLHHIKLGFCTHSTYHMSHNVCSEVHKYKQFVCLFSTLPGNAIQECAGSCHVNVPTPRQYSSFSI